MIVNKLKTSKPRNIRMMYTDTKPKLIEVITNINGDDKKYISQIITGKQF